MKKENYSCSDCVEIIRKLRSENGCPWDNEQTYDSLRKYLLEEVYEALDAVDRRNFSQIKEELGDVLWEVLFLARLAEQDGHFAMEEVFQILGEKMVRRHPHIFGDATIANSREVSDQWARIKKTEKKTDRSHHILANVPKSLPALLRAFRISERAAKEGFDWENADQVLEKVHEELGELEEARHEGDPEQIEEELGDLIFALVNYGRHLGVSPEDGLRRTMDKFTRRFGEMEDKLLARNELFSQKTLEELERLWQESKRK
jgi:tetrapyrrole methylase family protein / MazG family protein